MNDTIVDAAPGLNAPSLVAAEARADDIGRGILRVDPEAMQAMGLRSGDTVEIAGERTAIARLLPNFLADRGKREARMDGITRANAGATIGRPIVLRPLPCRPAEAVTLRAETGRRLAANDIDYMARRVDGVPVRAGDRLCIVLFGGRTEELVVEHAEPEGPVMIQPSTLLRVHTPPPPGAAARGAASAAAPRRPKGGLGSYEDVGGLEQEVKRLREMVELPLSRPELFARLGIAPPRGVLLYGPPGTGKTLLARAVANETRASFHYINGPEIIHKHYGASEARLREVFETARKAAPAIIFIDEIDAIAPRRDQVVGDVEKRVVATLLTLMDGLADRGDLVVIAATNLPNALDPALRRPGRFDRELALGVPNRDGRRKILAVHTRGMPLEVGVNLDRVAEMTHGFTGADLQSLCREAAMAVLRRHEAALTDGRMSPSDLHVEMADFEQTVRQITPSALREVTVESPHIHWADVGGAAEVKRRLQESVIWPLRHAATYARYDLLPPKGMILHGPPGTGKTLLARALATEAQVNFIAVRGPELLSKYVGDSERGVREVFAKARQAAPCILFLDELDSLVPARGRSQGTDVTDRVVAQFLVEIDGVRPLTDVWLVGATNRLDLIDPALLRPGRFELDLEVGLPDEEGRLEVLRVHTARKPLALDVELRGIAAETASLSGADLAMLCSHATLSAVRRAVSAQETGAEETVAVTADDFGTALAMLRARRSAASATPLGRDPWAATA
jgi:transitional endoplasmic reticulum ATPase